VYQNIRITVVARDYKKLGIFNVTLFDPPAPTPPPAAAALPLSCVPRPPNKCRCPPPRSACLSPRPLNSGNTTIIRRSPHPHQRFIKRLQKSRPIRFGKRRWPASNPVHSGAQVGHDGSGGDGSADGGAGERFAVVADDDRARL
jgi:hypothetical protein